MWLMTKYGFFSVVCVRDAHHNPIMDKVMVRSRIESHLAELQFRFRNILGSYSILIAHHTDYPFRLIISKYEWTTCVVKMTEDIDYCDFEDKVREMKIHGDKYINFLSEGVDLSYLL